ncbi:unnamed protein product [Nippostrongylus brasiliensis]|uniref:Uncharacterized protein n=1 Tax=Nippostrongylus brasiliensis TaxID=27835 RepID=A0A0N4XYW6_NIPBR|nr:unnamed protein product [Nippostrongylus brasiliensis]
MQGSGAQEPAIEDDMATPQGAQDRDKMAVWHLNKCGSSTKEKEDGATLMKDTFHNDHYAKIHREPDVEGQIRCDGFCNKERPETFPAALSQ